MTCGLGLGLRMGTCARELYPADYSMHSRHARWQRQHLGNETSGYARLSWI
jgi:hypothetical protein